jgi:hypothetical protein
VQGVGKVADRPAAGRRKRIPGAARSFFHHLARARSSAPQQGLVSLQGAERRRLRLLLFLLLAEGRCGEGGTSPLRWVTEDGSSSPAAVGRRPTPCIGESVVWAYGWLETIEEDCFFRSDGGARLDAGGGPCFRIVRPKKNHGNVLTNRRVPTALQ